MNSLQSRSLSALRWVAPGTYALMRARLPEPSIASMKAQSQAEPIPSPEGQARGLLYYACMFYTLALFAYNALECLTGGRTAVPESMGLIYLAILAAYAGDKEIGLWSSGEGVARSQKKKGEWFVFIWAAFAFVALALSGLSARFAVPHLLTQITLQVIGIFFGTQVSRRLRQARQVQDVLGKLEEEGLADRIFTLLQEHPGLTSGEISRRLGASQRRVQRILAKMVREGTLVRVAGNPNDPETSYRPA
ncbi:MAG: winged helix-turn-helix domain-containing protein [Elusimicrobia bacterium]|nr:winged helix-turn-helix domain-containing protein [Elusimicrobiota bacterium]